jgi:hypothetical protein
MIEFAPRDRDQLVDGAFRNINVGNLGGSRQHEYSRPVLDQEILKKTRIQPVDTPKCVLCRVTRGYPQAQCRVSNGKSEVDEQDASVGTLRQGDGNIAGDRRNAGSSFGPDKNVQPSSGFPSGISLLAGGGCGPNQSLRHSTLLEGQKEELTSTCTHGADGEFRICFLRIDHNRRRFVWYSLFPLIPERHPGHCPGQG